MCGAHEAAVHDVVQRWSALCSDLLPGHHPTTQPTASAPRLYVAAGRNARVSVSEEFVSIAPDACHAVVNAVTEVNVAEAGQVSLDYVNLEAPGTLHFRTTLVQQGADSTFRLTEARVGGSLTRHDLGVQQEGPDTFTSIRSFLLAGARQLHDLHSKLRYAPVAQLWTRAFFSPEVCPCGHTHTLFMQAGAPEGRG